ncbi:pseudouridylate synthase 1 homolog isoform X2 [Planococcus citri]
MADPWPALDKRKAENEADETESENKKPRVKRKMHALLLAYCGQGYLGLQRNQGLKTIEEDIMVALKKLELINDEEFAKQQLVHFQRAARTDKGVSALRQVINLNLRDGVKPEDINQHLPEQIRILAIKRVTKGFNSKNSCDYRTYSYTCPSFAFAPKSVKLSEDYRINDEVVENVNKWASCYVGTHNYHNFTSGRKPLDPSCKRHIMSVVCQPPVIRDELELVTFLVKGQSFMLHQIRKMIGVLMAIARGYVSPDYINKAFLANELLQLPVAPGLGLLLEQVHYDWYNKKYGENGIHEKLDFQDVEDLVSEFREKQIYPIIIREEKENKSMLNYMETLGAHYEEYHSETSDIFSKVLPNDFELENDTKSSGNKEAESNDTVSSSEEKIPEASSSN